ncbi:uncharacterized protein [Tenebrio molitor]|uniref:uncharacterized protein n=1 Tax=Tenebrio molitor TaxID=7067 RepID=UPI0036248423
MEEDQQEDQKQFRHPEGSNDFVTFSKGKRAARIVTELGSSEAIITQDINKGHLKRTIGEVVLSYEELYTLLTRIEAVLNSRPLCPLSNDPNDLNPITPGHFLIGEPLTSISERDLTTTRINRLTQWQRVEQMRQHFWHRWQREYLVQNINRSKQLRGSGSRPSTPALEVGSMVILVEDNTPPLQWKLGRIVELHPGSDGVVRVVSVKTVKGIFKRATRKVCVLPANE